MMSMFMFPCCGFALSYKRVAHPSFCERVLYTSLAITSHLYLFIPTFAFLFSRHYHHAIHIIDALAASGGLDKEQLRRQFEAGRREEGVGAQWSRSAAYEEDLSDMIAQESRKRQRREEERRGEREKGRR